MAYHRPLAPGANTEFTWVVQKVTGKGRSVKYSYRTYGAAEKRANEIAVLHSLDPKEVVSVSGNHVIVNVSAYYGTRKNLGHGSAMGSPNMSTPQAIIQKFKR